MSDDQQRVPVDWTEGAAAEHIDGFRRFIWNVDQLTLFGRRLGLRRGMRLADVGSGFGFFGRCFLPMVLPGGSLDGFELEPKLVAEANARAAADDLAEVARFTQADAMALSAEDASFDVTMCQTLLMHLPDAEGALAEMVRVTRPGGLVVTAEPDGLTNVMMERWAVDGGAEDTLEDAVEAALAFAKVIEGRRARGGGDPRIGTRMPHLMHRAGLTDVRAWLDDRLHVMHPPYEAYDQPDLLSWWRPVVETPDHLEMWEHFRQDLRAAGGDEARYDRMLARFAAQAREQAAGADRGALVRTAGGVLIMTAGRRPSAEG